MTAQHLGVTAQPMWLDEAWRLHGIHERRGRVDHPEIMSLYHEIGHPGIAHDETPWCAAFVGACLERSGRLSTRSLMARSYSHWGTALQAGRLGAIAVLSRGSDPALGHVGFWVGATASKLFLLGGNQSNTVSVAAYDRNRLLDFRWPFEDQTDTHLDPITGPHPDFERALAHVLEMEGGYSDDPYDPGGPTNFGITLQVYATWQGVRLSAVNRALLKAQLKKISRADVAAIYKKNYWQRAACDDFSPALSLMHFDTSVNQGVSRAVGFLQHAVKTDVDGEIGPLTRAAAAQQPVRHTLDVYAALRRDHYRSLHHFWRFGRGWLRRVKRTLALSKTIADEVRDDPSTPLHQSPFEQPCNQTFQKEPTMTTKSNSNGKAKWWGSSMTIWGILLTTLTTVLPTLGPLIGVELTPDIVKDAGQQLVTTVQAISGLLGTLMAIYGRARANKPLGLRDVSLRL